MKKYYIILFALLLNAFCAFSQVSTDPPLVIEDKPVTIFYDATKGTSGLVGAAKVYMHAGVVLSNANGTGWSNVVGNWGKDDGLGQMTKVEGQSNLWKITIPSLREYFNVSEDQTIYRIGMVFRNADGSKEGKNSQNQDIFVQVYKGFAVTIEIPEGASVFVQPGQVIQYKAKSTENSWLYAILDGVVIKEIQDSNIIEGSFTVSGSGKQTFKVKAVKGELEAIETVDLVFKAPSVSKSLPAGIRLGVNKHQGDNSVTFALQAPLKSSAYVVGDFTEWKVNPDFRMFIDGEVFWLNVTGLDPNFEYAFYYLVDENIKIADPYSDKVLAAGTDQEIIHLNKYPGLRPFPNQSDTERVTAFKLNDQEYQWQATDYQRPAKEDLIIYELLVRDFTDQRSYQAVIDKLDYLKDLGINAIELMPVNEFNGNNSWGYNPAFMLAVDKFYGPRNKLKELVDKAHQKGMAVILDIVLNHQDYPAPYLKLWGDGYGASAENPFFNVTPTHPFNVFTDMNHESKYTQAFVDTVNAYWIREYKIDGYRYDLSKGFTQKNSGNNVALWSQYDASRIAILKRMADHVWKVDPEAYVILEHFADNAEEKELANYGMMLWGNLNHNYSDAAMGYNDNNKSNLNWISHKERDFNEPHLIGYMESHDEERMMYRLLNYGASLNDYSTKDLSTALERVKMAAAFFIPVPGPKMIWQFGELGYDVSIDEGGRLGIKPAHWHYYEDENRKKLFEVFAALNKLKVTHPVFKTSDFTMNTAGEFKTIQLKSEGLTVNIVGNFTTRARHLTVPFPASGDWWDYFSGDKLSLTGTSYSMTFQPGQFHVFFNKEVVYEGANPTNFRLHEEVTTSVNKKDLSNKINIYPNPANNILNIDFTYDGLNFSNPVISLINAQGQVVRTQTFKNQLLRDCTIDINHVKPGLYFLEISLSERERIVKKVVIK